VIFVNKAPPASFIMLALGKPYAKAVFSIDNCQYNSGLVFKKIYITKLCVFHMRKFTKQTSKMKASFVNKALGS
jgi:hypothetical protein